jgi:hypothetical protein
MLTVLVVVSLVVSFGNALLVAKLYRRLVEATRGVQSAESAEKAAEHSGTHPIGSAVARGSRVSSEESVKAHQAPDDSEDEPTQIHPAAQRRRRSA